MPLNRPEGFKPPHTDASPELTKAGLFTIVRRTIGEKGHTVVGIPGTEERLALAEVEDRLRRVRTRCNLYTLQHNLYGLGTALVLGVALLIFFAFTLSPLWFTLLSWPMLVLLAFLFLFYLRRGITGWLDLNAAARRVDTKAGLKERFSTLVAQLTIGIIGKPAPSVLWPHLLQENISLLADWNIKQVAPQRIPWNILPFLLASLLALLIASIPMISGRSAVDPFSLSNLQTVLAELPDRAGDLLNKKLSLLPDPPEQWGGSSLFDNETKTGETGKNTEERQNSQQDENRRQDARSLASLPEELQKKIRQALQGLPEKDRNQENQDAGQLAKDRRLALQPSDEKKKPTASVESKDLPPGNKLQSSARDRNSERKSGSPSTGAGGAAQAPAQGSGIQQLDRAQLDRKNARGVFQPDSPQIPGRNGEAGEGGPGAGSGSDPRLYGEQTALDSGSHTFQLALDTTHEKGKEGEATTEDDDTGGIIEKSGKGLSQQQSLDDAIRKSRVPAEYEDIVKRLFARGESR